MALFKQVNGVRIQLTPEEEAEVLAERETAAQRELERHAMEVFHFKQKDVRIEGMSVRFTPEQKQRLVGIKVWLDSLSDAEKPALLEIDTEEGPLGVSADAVGQLVKANYFQEFDLRQKRSEVLQKIQAKELRAKADIDSEFVRGRE